MGKKAAFSQAESMTISDRETVRVVLNPTRNRLITALAQEARTVKELSAILGQEPTKLYYHIKLLLKTGIIAVAGERQIGNLTETSYICAAKSYIVDPAIAESLEEVGGPEAMASSFLSMLKSSLFASCRKVDEAKKARRARSKGAEETIDESEVITMILETFRLAKGEAKDFTARLRALIAEYETRNGETETGSFYELGFVLFPSASGTRAPAPEPEAQSSDQDQEKENKDGI